MLFIKVIQIINDTKNVSELVKNATIFNKFLEVCDTQNNKVKIPIKGVIEIKITGL